MKLSAIYLYQAVMWKKSNVNFISNTRQGHEDTEIILKDNHIHIKCDTDEIIVFATNVAYCKPAVEAKDESKSNKKPIKIDKL